MPKYEDPKNIRLTIEYKQWLKIKSLLVKYEPVLAFIQDAIQAEIERREDEISERN